MQPLLRIQNVPIEISYRSKRAELRQTTPQPRAQVTRVKGKQEIRTEPAQIKIDSYEMRASMGLKTAPRSVEEFSQAGRADALTATAQYAEEGNNIMESYGEGEPIIDNAMSKVLSTTETYMNFIPSVRPQMWVEGGTISFDYSMDRLNYDWNVSTRPEMEYIPGGVEFSVDRYHQVIIEYLGGPVYVPPSADPNYEPPPSVDIST